MVRNRPAAVSDISTLGRGELAPPNVSLEPARNRVGRACLPTVNCPSRRLLRAQAAHQLGEEPRDVTAVEVLGNIEAMLWVVEAVLPGRTITVEIVLEAHRRLLAGTRLAEHAGRYCNCLNDNH